MTRAIFGTVLIVLTMVLTAWVALNEPTRIATYDAQFQGRSIESGAQNFDQYCSTCHGFNGEGVPGKGPALYPRLFTEREGQLKAARSVPLRDFVELTVAGGRPVWSQDFAGAGFAEHMPTWSQRYGGPLRDDQIRDIVNFIMNWREAAGQPTATPSAPTVDANYPPAEPLPAGDPNRGKALLNGDQMTGAGLTLPCYGCHVIPGADKAQGVVGPSLAGIDTTAAARLTENYAGKATDAQGYIHESIVQPNAHIAGNDPKYTNPADGKSIMPANLATFMTAQDLADVLAYLTTLK